MSASPAESCIPAARILRVFLWIAATTFGSSQSAAIQREIVRVRGWLSMEEFLTLRGLALVVPGPNSPNLAILVGMRLAGPRGAVLAYLAASVPGIVITMLLGALALDMQNPVIAAALRGATAAATGIICANALQLTAIYRGRLLPLVLIVLTLFAVTVVHFSLWLTLAVFLPISIAALQRGARLGSEKAAPR